MPLLGVRSPGFQSPESPGSRTTRIYSRILPVQCTLYISITPGHFHTLIHSILSYDDRHDVFDMTENKRHLQHRNAGLREVVSLSFFASNPNAHKSGFNSWR